MTEVSAKRERECASLSVDRPCPWWQLVQRELFDGVRGEERLAEGVRPELAGKIGRGVVAAVGAHVTGLAAVDGFSIDLGFSVLPPRDDLLDLERPDERRDEVRRVELAGAPSCRP